MKINKQKLTVAFWLAWARIMYKVTFGVRGNLCCLIPSIGVMQLKVIIERNHICSKYAEAYPEDGLEWRAWENNGKRETLSDAYWFENEWTFSLRKKLLKFTIKNV